MAMLGFALLSFRMLFLLLLLLFLVPSFGTQACFPPDLEALRSFATSFTNSDDMEDWTGDDCCSWTGVTCSSSENNATARVSKLQVAFIISDNTRIPEAVCNLSALSSLEILESFLSERIPDCLGDLSDLQILNLEGNNLHGSIPSSFSRLLDLQELYLYENTALSGSLAPLSNLPKLNTIYLASNAFSGPLPPFNSPLLEYIDVSSNSLNSTLLDFALHSNLPSLSSLLLSDNSFSGSIPPSISRFRSRLRDLSLGNNLLSGALPQSLCQLTSLGSLDLSSNAFTGTIPLQCQSLTNLSSLDLSHNQFTGPFPPWIANLPSLQDLVLSFNLFSGSPPDEWQILQNLTVIDLSGNSLPLPNATAPRLPDWIFRSPKIQDLSLASMGLQLKDLECDGRVSMLNKTLRLLDLSNNNLSGVGMLQCLALHNFSRFSFLNLSGNPLSLFLPDTPLPQGISSLDMSSCDLQGNLTDKFLEPVEGSINAFVLADNHLVGKIPRKLGNMSKLFHLDLSGNHLTGFDHFENSSLSDLSEFYLSHNAFTGDLLSLLGLLSSTGLPEICSRSSFQLWTNMDLSHNNLTGQIPSSLGQCDIIERVKLNDNNLVGHIPDELGSLTYLKTLTLSNNHLTGNIPASIANSTSLVVLDLSYNELEGDLKALFSFSELMPEGALRVLLLGHNRLSGSIPISFGRNTPALQLIDLSYNNLTGSIPESLYLPAFHVLEAAGSDGAKTSSLLAQRGKLFEELQIVVKGVDLKYAYLLEVLTSLDLSGNNLEGAIPSQLGEMSGLRYLNLSHNTLSGSIPADLSKLSILEALDLSFNKLEGFIPSDLSSLTKLADFNVSFNEALKGSIPGGPQFESKESYIGDPQLCGYPVLEACKQLDAAPPISSVLNAGDEEGQEGPIIQWINEWLSIPGLCLGIVVGFGGVLWVRHGPAWRNYLSVLKPQ